MGPAWFVVLGAALVLTLAAVAALVVARVRASRQRLEQELAGSLREVQQLAEQVQRLADDVATGGREARPDHEYVITTLGDAAQLPPRTSGAAVPTPAAQRLATALQQQAVAALARLDTSSRRGAVLTRAGVRVLAWGHGARRALSQENRDRAAAETHVARRRSRRTRRQELREARRLVRAVRSQQVAGGSRAGDAA